MKKLVMICIIAVLMGCAGHQQPKGPRYTAYNIWIHRGVLACINYKLGNRIIAAGTPVKGVKIVNKDGAQLIVFRIAESNQKISVSFTPRWHPDQTVKSFVKKMFTKKRFEQRTRKLTSTEIKSIKKGIVTEGMSKKAVLISYGPPPEHRTPSLAKDRWIYWLDKHRMKTICFDENRQTIRCSKLKSNEL
jgi:hypothetical protein